jgi:hypothetical protein
VITVDEVQAFKPWRRITRQDRGSACHSSGSHASPRTVATSLARARPLQ